MSERLLDVAMLYVNEAAHMPLAGNLSDQIRAAFKRVIAGDPPDDLPGLLVEHVGSTAPLDRITNILAIPVESRAPVVGESARKPEGARRKPWPWTPAEDSRLLAAIHHRGVADWVAVAHFVGGGRSRAQCAQRWNRGLDPRISKASWTAQEEEKLLRAILEAGRAGWTRVSAEMGNRSDTQCRYHFKQMMLSGRLPLGFALPPGFPGALSARPASELFRGTAAREGLGALAPRGRGKSPKATRMAMPPPLPPPASPAPTQSTGFGLFPKEGDTLDWNFQSESHPLTQWW
jgi:hypothetical protein